VPAAAGEVISDGMTGAGVVPAPIVFPVPSSPVVRGCGDRSSARRPTLDRSMPASGGFVVLNQQFPCAAEAESGDPVPEYLVRACFARARRGNFQAAAAKK
jgi:hypothetical protein